MLKVKDHMYTEMCAVKLYTTVSCITEPIICIQYLDGHSSDPYPLLKGGSKFDYLPRMEEPKNFKKRRWKYGAGKSLLKSGGADTFLFIFFKFYHFYI